MTDLTVTLPLKRFILVDQCPPDWKGMDLYLFRDERAVFYVGQSEHAFGRVWEHLLGGFHGHSIVGRFLWVNWPRSMNVTIALLSSRSGQFDAVGHDLNEAERQLIEQYSPCFNVTLNRQPTPVPDGYLPANAPYRHRRSLNMLVHEAERAVHAEDTKLWMQTMQ